MIRFRTEQTVERSAADVLAYAADILRHPEWMGVTGARILRSEGTDAGARAAERMKLGPSSTEIEFEVSAGVPAQRMAWRVVGGGPLAGEVTLDLEALGPTSTRAALVALDRADRTPESPRAVDGRRDKEGRSSRAARPQGKPREGRVDGRCVRVSHEADEC